MFDSMFDELKKRKKEVKYFKETTEFKDLM